MRQDYVNLEAIEDDASSTEAVAATLSAIDQVMEVVLLEENKSINPPPKDSNYTVNRFCNKVRLILRDHDVDVMDIDSIVDQIELEFLTHAKRL